MLGREAREARLGVAIYGGGWSAGRPVRGSRGFFGAFRVMGGESYGLIGSGKKEGSIRWNITVAERLCGGTVLMV